jgi:hypothetical protein
MSGYIDNLRGAIRRLHGLQAVHLRTVPLTEQFEGKILWQGEVETFSVSGHPQASLCFAWAYQDYDGKQHYTAILELPPVNSERAAVRVALIAQVKNQDTGTLPRTAKAGERQHDGPNWAVLSYERKNGKVPA